MAELLDNKTWNCYTDIDNKTWNCYTDIDNKTCQYLKGEIQVNKEEILEKSRNSHEDEGMEYAQSQGRKIGFYAFDIVFAILILSATFLARSNQIATITALLALSMTFWAAESYAKYKFIKSKLYFGITLIGVLGASLNVIAYIVIILR